MDTVMAVTFDTLAYSKELRAAGVPERQAEVQAEALAKIIDEKLATKKDLQEMEERFNNRMSDLNYKITIKLGSLIVIAVAVLSAVIKL